MKTKRIFVASTLMFVASAVLTSCDIFSSSPKMENYVDYEKSPYISSFEELNLKTYGFHENSIIDGTYANDTHVIEHDGKYGLINVKTKARTTLKYDYVGRNNDVSSSSYSIFVASKMVGAELRYGIVTVSSETDFTAKFSNSFSISNDIVETPKAYYRIEGEKLNLIANKQSVDSLTHSSLGYNTHSFGDYIFDIYSSSSFGNKTITTYKKFVYQHTFTIPNTFSIHYLGEGQFLFQENELVYSGEHIPSSYDYVDASSQDYFRITTKKYNALNNKSENSNFKEPIYSISHNQRPLQEKMAGITFAKKSFVAVVTYRVNKKVMSDSGRNFYLMTPDMKMIADISNGDRVLTNAIDDLKIYHDISQFMLIKNKAGDTVFAGESPDDIRHNSIKVSYYDNYDAKYYYGAITSSGGKIDMKYDQLEIGPNDFFGKRGDEFYRIAYDGKETKLNNVTQLNSLFYVINEPNRYQIKSYYSDKYFEFNRASWSANYMITAYQESILFTLSEQGSLRYRIGNIAF